MAPPRLALALSLTLAACGTTTADPAGDPSQPPLPSLPTGPAPIADYGDAPDGRLQPDGSFGREGYPTLFGGDGARVLDVSAVALVDNSAGGTISMEVDANDNADPDGDPNFRRFEQPDPDRVNRDDNDNGVITAKLDLTNVAEPMLDITVGALLKDQAAAGTYYLNVLFDENIDGAWNGADKTFVADQPPQMTTQIDLNDEWIVKNMQVELTDTSTVQRMSFSLPLVGAITTTQRLDTLLGPYMRLALTSERIEVTAWQGEGEFKRGEIEDWLIAGFEDAPDVVCDAPKAMGIFNFDFAGNNQIPLPCGLVRPAFSSPATSTDFFYNFRYTGPAGGDTVNIACNPAVPARQRAMPGQATAAAPLPMNCTATKRGNVKMTMPTYELGVSTDLNGAVLIKRGFDSAVTVELSAAPFWFAFEESTDPPQQAPITACLGVTGSYDNINGGMILQLTKDKADCAMVPNDGQSEGSFIISAGNGFRGRTEMFLSVIGGGAAFITAGQPTRLVFNGEQLNDTRWDVPTDRDSINTLEVEFGKLSFEIEVKITFNPMGLNTVTLTVVNGMCLGE